MVEGGPSAPQQEERKSSFSAFGGRGVALGSDMEAGRSGQARGFFGSGAAAAPLDPGVAPAVSRQDRVLTDEARRARDAQAQALRDARERQKGSADEGGEAVGRSGSHKAAADGKDKGDYMQLDKMEQ